MGITNTHGVRVFFIAPASASARPHNHLISFSCVLHYCITKQLLMLAKRQDQGQHRNTSKELPSPSLGIYEKHIDNYLVAVLQNSSYGLEDNTIGLKNKERLIVRDLAYHEAVVKNQSQETRCERLTSMQYSFPEGTAVALLVRVNATVLCPGSETPTTLPFCPYAVIPPSLKENFSAIMVPSLCIMYAC
ncbi:hypothetical protein BJV74DRAFT_172627 [Russula compacta]|nr:hypothetical protein BJV74DRAFT_172627 [Russula compacta]